MRAPGWVLSVLLASAAARADWPRRPGADTPAPPPPAFGWSALPAWVAPAPAQARAARDALDAISDASPAREERRAVLLRLLSRPDDAEAALARARAAQEGSLRDPDALLTAAWLEARRGRFDPATAHALRALPLLPARSEALSLTAARWSLARGPEGLADARRVLDAMRMSGGWSPRAAALAALVMARSGDEGGAGELARSLHDALSPSLAEPLPADRHDPAFAEQVNAVGLALLLDGRPAEALPLLRRTLEQTPPAWRGFQQRALLRAGH